MLVHKNLGYDYVRGGLILKYSSTSCAVTALLSNQNKYGLQVCEESSGTL